MYRTRMFARKFLLIFVFLISSFVEVSFAAERREFYTGVRQLGMGGVAVATVNDETALLLNPAALGRLRNNYITLIDPEFETNSDLISFVLGGNFTELYQAQGILDMLNENPSRRVHTKFQLFPSIIMKNFGIGFFSKYEIDAEIVNDELQMSYINDYALVLGFNVPLWEGRIKIGANAKLINHAVLNESYPTTSTGLNFSNDIKEGVGLSTDLGLILTAPWKWLPTVAAVWRDASGTNYNFLDGMLYGASEKPDATPSQLDVGVSVNPITSKRGRMQIGIEYRDLLNPATSTKGHYNRTHLGIEWNMSDIFFFRLGANQMHWTAGLEFAVQRFQFQAATYGEELGDGVNNRVERRYIGKFSYRF